MMSGDSLGTDEETGTRPDPVVVWPTCEGPADVRSRHVLVDGSSVRIFCSLACKDGARVEPYEIIEVLTAEEVHDVRPSYKSRLTIGGALVGCCFLLLE